ncbi:MAG: kinase [Polyangiales bacterium]
MIISRTPFRISFFGGGTDYPGWYKLRGGSVLSTTIDKYCYLTCRRLPPFFEHRVRVVYSTIENCRSVDEIKHPVVREVLRFVGIEQGVEIHHDGDLPARSGMASSSAFTVGLLNSLYALKGEMPDKHRLAMESIHLEQDVLREHVGSQDQVAVTYGGLNHIRFEPNGNIHVRPVTLSQARMQELSSHLMLFYTGIKRTASDVAATFTDKLDERETQLRAMSQLVDEAIALLTSDDDILRFGRLLHTAWRTKCSLSSTIGHPKIQSMYDAARSAGAIGGKITGAGGGGFLVLFAPPAHQAAIREKLKKLLLVPFKFEFSGSQIIFFTPEPDYSGAERDRAEHPIAPFRELTPSEHPRAPGPPSSAASD